MREKKKGSTLFRVSVLVFLSLVFASSTKRKEKKKKKCNGSKQSNHKQQKGQTLKRNKGRTTAWVLLPSPSSSSLSLSLSLSFTIETKRTTALVPLVLRVEICLPHSKNEKRAGKRQTQNDPPSLLHSFSLSFSPSPASVSSCVKPQKREQSSPIHSLVHPFTHAQKQTSRREDQREARQQKLQAAHIFLSLCSLFPHRLVVVESRQGVKPVSDMAGEIANKYWIESTFQDEGVNRAFERLADSIEALTGQKAVAKVGDGIILHSTLLFIGAKNPGLTAHRIRELLGELVERNGPRLPPQGSSIHFLGYGRVTNHIILPFLPDGDEDVHNLPLVRPGTQELVLEGTFQCSEPQYQRIHNFTCDLFDVLSQSSINIAGAPPDVFPWFPHLTLCQFEDEETCIKVMKVLSEMDFSLPPEITSLSLILDSPQISYRSNGTQVKLPLSIHSSL